MKADTLLKIESNIKAMTARVNQMLQRDTIEITDDVDDLRSLTSQNLELIGGDVCDLCGDPTKSTRICWPCWRLEIDEIVEE